MPNISRFLCVLLVLSAPSVSAAQTSPYPPTAPNYPPTAPNGARQPVQRVQFVSQPPDANSLPPANVAPQYEVMETLPEGERVPAADELAPSPTILSEEFNPINLESAFRLGGVQNPQIRLAGQRINQAVAERQLAAAVLLPTLNAGSNYDIHTGVLQQSSGNILATNRAALFAGAGANAIAAGTVNVPGVVWNANLTEALFTYLKSRQRVSENQATLFATGNHELLEVATAYLELIRAEQSRAIADQIRSEALEVAKFTAAYAATGQGREADANRAATEFRQRDVDVLTYEADIIATSARLAQLLNLDPSVRLHPTDPWAVPLGIVSDSIMLPQLIAIGMMQRPELASQRAAVRYALLNLRNYRMLPFSPNTLIGFSAGTFGGGSNLTGPPYNVGSVFGNFAGRSDFDVVAYWSLQNMAVGNVALIRQAAAEYQISNWELIKILNMMRKQIASSRAESLAHFAQIVINERAVRTGQAGFDEDLLRTKAAEGLPIEVLNNLDLLARARFAYLASIIQYNVAQFSLYVALGQPPAAALTQPIGEGGPNQNAAPLPALQQPGGQMPAPPQPPAPLPNNP